MIRMYEDLFIFLRFFSQVKSLEIRDETKMRSEEVKTKACVHVCEGDRRQQFSYILQYNPSNTIRMYCSHYILYHGDVHNKISRSVM